MKYSVTFKFNCLHHFQLLEVLSEEARLDQLVAEARRRRQLDHRLLVDQLLEERRALRAAAMKQHRQEHQQALQYEQLRSVNLSRSI